MTIALTTNHKVNDRVYVISEVNNVDCVRRGIVQQVDFRQPVAGTPSTLSYEILFDGFVINTTVTSTLFSAGSPFNLGSPVFGSPMGSPFDNVPGFGSPINEPGTGSPNTQIITVIEDVNGGGIYVSKTAALNAFGALLA